jgi:membrane protease YdiL (CAAX protease family)
MESKRLSPWRDLGILAAIFFGATLLVGICMAVVMTLFPKLERGPMMFIVYVAQFSLAVAAGLVWLRREGRGGLGFGMGWSDAPVIVLGIVLVTAASIVIEPLINLFPEHYLERLNEMIGRGGWALATTVVAAPVLEEIFFRGILLERLSRRWSATAAVTASAALFGLAHAPIWPQALNAFVIAVVMGYLYLQTRSLIPVIIIHAINNGLAYLTLELTGTQSTDTREMIGNDTLYWIVYAASAVILVASIVLMALKSRNKTDEIPLNEKTADAEIQ